MDKKLRIAMVVRSFTTNGGLELYTHKLVEGLLGRGHTVTVICEENQSQLRHEDLDFVHFDKSTSRSKAQRLRNHFHAASQALKALPSFDVVHSQHFPVEGANVVTFHNQTVYQLDRVGLPFEKAINTLKRNLVPAYRLRDSFDAFLCKKARCLVFPALVMKEDFYDTYKLGDTPYVVAHPGADLAGGGAEISYSAKPFPFTFLFVGKGFRKKGLDILLKACAILRRQKRQFRLLIAGLRMKPLDKLRLQRHGLSDVVNYLGFQKDMGSVYAQAHAFVLPSRMEPFGMAPLQAMRWGVPAIVSRVSGVSEVLHHESDGLILEHHTDPDELAKLMTRLMDDADLLSRLSRQAQVISSEVTWDKTVESTLESYRLVQAGASTQAAINANGLT